MIDGTVIVHTRGTPRPEKVRGRSLPQRAAAVPVSAFLPYIIRRSSTGSPSDETHWLPNKEMTKPCEVSDETSTNLFPHFQCQTLQCDTSTLNLRLGGSGPVA